MIPERMRRMSLLLDFYGEMLSARQRQLCEYYYNDDLSLSEIAENTGITRQGISDGIKKSERILLESEEKLGMFSAWLRRQKDAEAVENRLRALGVEDREVYEALERLKA